MTQLSHLARSFAALAEPTRLRLMLACRERELLVGQLARVLGLPEPAVSRHLATLARAGLLSRVQSGREVRYGWSAEARDSAWLNTALAPLLGADAAQRRDQSRLARLATAPSAQVFAADTLFGQRLAAGFRQLANNVASARVLAVNVAHGPVLAWLQEFAAALRVVATEPPRPSCCGHVFRRGHDERRTVSVGVDFEAERLISSHARAEACHGWPAVPSRSLRFASLR